MELSEVNTQIGILPCQTLIEEAFLAYGLHPISPDLMLDRKLDGQKLIRAGEFASYITSMDDMDYRVYFPQSLVVISVDVKDKALFVPKNWGLPNEEHDDWFVVDETASKKLANEGRRGFILFHDYNTEQLYCWSSQAMALGYKKWAVRIHAGETKKYKLLYHVSSAEAFTDWLLVFEWMISWVNSTAKELAGSGSRVTWYNHKMRDIIFNLQVRTEAHRQRDLESQGGGVV